MENQTQNQPQPNVPWTTNLSWKIWGFLASLVAGFFSGAGAIMYGIGGCAVDVECAIIPYMLTGFFFVSAILALVYLVSFFLRRLNLRKITKIYLLLVLLGAIIFVTFQRNGVAYEALHGTELECSLYSGSHDKRGRCLSQLAQIKHDITICQRPETSDWKSDCLRDFAIEAKNPDLCDTGDSLCVLGVAREAKDIKLCERIPSESIYGSDNAWMKSECYESISRDLDDPSICAPNANGESRCASPSAIYTASSVRFSLNSDQPIVHAGAKQSKILSIKATARDGAGQITEIGITNRAGVKIQNIKLMIYGNTYMPIRTTELDNDVYRNATQYDFKFGSDGTVIPNTMPATIEIIGDIPAGTEGKSIGLHIGLVGSDGTSQYEGIGELWQASIR